MLSNTSWFNVFIACFLLLLLAMVAFTDRCVNGQWTFMGFGDIVRNILRLLCICSLRMNKNTNKVKSNNKEMFC